MKRKPTVRQLAAAAFTGALSPAAAAAGLDWRGGLLAVPVVLVVAWCWNQLGAGPGGWVASWRGFMGKVLSFIYIVWSLVLAGAVLAAAGSRMTVPDGRREGWVSLLVWLCALWLVRSNADAFGRAAEIFRIAMTAALVVVVAFAAVQVRLRWLLADTGTLLPSFLVAAGVGCCGVSALLLWEGGEGGGRHWLRWGGAGAAAVTLLSAVTVGALSPTLAMGQTRPFFIMTVGLGRTARIEGLVSAIWLLADVTLLTLLLHGGRRLWSALGLPWEKGAPWVLAVVTLGLALLLQYAGQAETLLRGPLPLAGLVLGGLLPVVACLWQKCRGACAKE